MSADTAAHVGGNRWGKTKLISVSPNKTREVAYPQQSMPVLLADSLPVPLPSPEPTPPPPPLPFPPEPSPPPEPPAPSSPPPSSLPPSSLPPSSLPLPSPSHPPPPPRAHYVVGYNPQQWMPLLLGQASPRSNPSPQPLSQPQLPRSTPPGSDEVGSGSEEVEDHTAKRLMSTADEPPPSPKPPKPPPSPSPSTSPPPSPSLLPPSWPPPSPPPPSLPPLSSPPPSPSPPPPSPPPPPSTGTVVITLMVSGSVDDFSGSDKSSLQAKVATTAGVDKWLVKIRVAAASVRITATIAVPASTTPAAVNIALTSRLGTVAAASNALGVALEEVSIITTVSSDLINDSEDAIPVIGLSDASEDEVGSPGSDSSESLQNVGIALGVSFSVLLVSACYLVRRRLRNRATTEVTLETKDVTLDLEEGLGPPVASGPPIGPEARDAAAVEVLIVARRALAAVAAQPRLAIEKAARAADTDGATDA